MSYIRTEDGVYDVSVSECISANGTVYSRCYQHSELIKQSGNTCTLKIRQFNATEVLKESDSLFDLIDGFYVDTDNYKFDYGAMYTKGNFDLFVGQLARFKKAGIKCHGYGFIKTKTCLKFVAEAIEERLELI